MDSCACRRSSSPPTDVHGDSVCLCVLARGTDKAKQHELKGEEIAVVDRVTVIGTAKDKDLLKANVRLRFNRNPVIGDKFSSRHGQKGVLSRVGGRQTTDRLGDCFGFTRCRSSR
jgi:RNA polymerase Rpb2, domain 6